jgi:serine/threonine-protein kinase
MNPVITPYPKQHEEGGATRRGSGVHAETSIGKYRLVATLGGGGQAEVFLAIAQGQLGTNKLVVVKRLRSHLVADDAVNLQMFLDEARLGLQLSHPNIVHTYEVGEHEGTFFIAMEYLDGQSLWSMAAAAAKRGGGVPAEIALRVVSDALAGLHHAHELRDYGGRSLGIVHRDVSPHNVFVTYDGTVKVVDFGIAKATLNSTHTETGMIKGKAGYMAPEQACGVVDRRSDVFAMGVVLWELLAGRRLFTGDAVQALHKVMSMPIPRLSSVVQAFDAGLDAVVDKALQRDPADRYQSADEMRRALERHARVHEPRAEAADVGAYVTELFGDVRQAMRKRIEAALASFTEGGAQRTSIADLSISGNGKGTAGPGSDSHGRSPRAGEVSPEAADSRRRRWRALLGTVAPGVAVLGAALLLLRTRAPSAPPAAAAPSPPAAASTPAPAASVPVFVTIDTAPADAVVEWNGRPLGVSPATIPLPPGTHQTIFVSKSGYLTTSVDIAVPEASQAPLLQSLTLQPAPPVKPVAPSAVVGRRPPAAPGSAAVAVRPERPAPSLPAPAAEPISKPTVRILDPATDTPTHVRRLP